MLAYLSQPKHVNNVLSALNLNYEHLNSYPNNVLLNVHQYNTNKTLFTYILIPNKYKIIK